MIKLKKDSFEKGAFTATLCIFISKFIGILYVIPFYMLITSKGAALYSYAYNVYAIFLSIGTAGVPLALSKIASEYDAKKMYDAKERSYKLSIQLTFIISIISFAILMIFTPQIARLIIGDSNGGNTINDIILAIRTVAFALLILPFLSVSRGFLQGNKYITPSSISQVIEQLVRVIIVLGGCYLVLKILNLSETTAILIAVSGATVGGLGAYLYLSYVFDKHKKQVLPQANTKDDITSKAIIKKIIKYSIPFIIVNVAFAIYNFVDIVIIYRVLTGVLDYAATEAENIISIYSTWAEKFQRIVIAVSTGVAISLIPNVVKHYVNKNEEGVKNTFNKAIQLVIFASLPLTILISIFAKDVWYVFYGNDKVGPIIVAFSIFVAFISSINTVITSALQGLNKYKIVYISLITGILINASLDAPLIIIFNKLGIYPYYGAISSSIIGFGLANLIALKMAKKVCNIDYQSTYKMIGRNILSIIILIALSFGLKYLLPYNYSNRIIGAMMTTLYFVIPLAIYIYINYKSGLLTELLKKS